MDTPGSVANVSSEMLAAHAKYRADMISYMSSGGDVYKMFEYLGVRARTLFSCDLVGYSTVEGRSQQWFRDGVDDHLCRRCKICPLFDWRSPRFKGANGVVLMDEIGRETGIDRYEDCPCKSAIASAIVVNGKPWGVVTLLRFEPHAFSTYGKENMDLLGKTVQVMLEREQYLVTLRQERDRALAAEKAKSFFFSSVSHDIRTPLNAIVGYSQMLKLGIDDKEERKTAIDSILTSSQTLLQLVNDVLDLAKLESGRMDILPEPTDCRNLVAGVLNAFRGEARKRGLNLVIQMDKMPLLEIDPQRIRQILFNLVGNAIKFTEKGSVTVVAAYEGECLSLSVRDTGCGIAEEDLHKLAQPFVQVGSDGRKRALGTGLGLSIVRQLVVRMRGSVEIESGLGVGTTVDIAIPNVKAASLAHGGLSVTQRIRLAATPSPKGMRRILVADDSKVNLAVIRAMLKTLGQTDVTMAANGREALAALTANASAEGARPFDLVLTDMWMPEMDGEELVGEIRRRPDFNALPVYAVTADVESTKSCAKLGFTGVLLKPLTLESLKGLLEA